MVLKGQCHEIFYLWFFFFKLFLLGPVDMPRNDFDFLRLFAEIFDYFFASPVSLTTVNNSSLVSMTPVSDTFTVLESFTGVNDTGKKLPVSLTPAKHAFACVNDTGEACIWRCQ